jgi:hypothetical protein
MRETSNNLTKNYRIKCGTRLVFNFLRGSDDFIVQKVYLLRLVLLCFGLITLAAYLFILFP